MPLKELGASASTPPAHRRADAARLHHSFKTAWVAHEEHIPLEEIFGTPDIIAVDLEDAAKQIIARETE